MSVLKKLTEARLQLATVKMNKSGHNSYAKFHYHELEDFLPHVTRINHELGLTVTMSFEPTKTIDVTLEGKTPPSVGRGVLRAMVWDSDGDTDQKPLVFESPYTEDAMNGNVLGIQKIGSVHTYMRRYMYLLIYDITEADAINALIAKPNPVLDELKKVAREHKIYEAQLVATARKKWQVNSLYELSDDQLVLMKNAILENLQGS